MQTKESTRAEAKQSAARRANLGRALVASAVLAPALVVLGVYLFLQGNLYHYHVPGPKWPWIVADLCVLGIGVLLMRGEDL